MPTILTCAVTGGAPIQNNPAVPITPQQIAEQALDAAKAGAAVAHIHVRDPNTGRSSMELDLYREVVERIRDSGSDVIINLTTGTGAQFQPGKEDPKVAGPGTEYETPEVRARHVAALKPDMCSLDFCTMWFRTRAFINSPEHIAQIAATAKAAGTLTEFECFDTGDINLARHMMNEGLVASPGFFQLVMGVSYGLAATPETMMYLKNLLPPGSKWAAFGIGAMAYPMLAQALLLGGHVRVGLEDNYYVDKGKKARHNADLVEKAVTIMRSLGHEPATPTEARQILGITRRNV
ncbi:MAG TPA: 3-keto-5-aminohexanoate cleavage protein [Xanthobacteraceae bacterium]|nr:3-keto-5-aminohexanoate cleavage protein [Xanthobacteraceae bacterium]